MLQLALRGAVLVLALWPPGGQAEGEDRQALEAKLNEVEALQLQLEALQLQAEEGLGPFQEKLEEKQWEQHEHARREAKLFQACHRYRRGMSQLRVHGAAAFQAGQALSTWALTARRLRARLHQCEEAQRHLDAEESLLSQEEKRLLRIEESLEQTRAHSESLSQKLKLRGAQLTDALTALPDLLHASSQATACSPSLLPASAGGADCAAATDTAALKGRLSPPVFGFIERHFGPETHPKSHTTTLHKGIHIRAARGSRVRAVAPGKAVFVGHIKGLGKVVVLEHTGGLHSLAAQLEEVYIKAGERVTQGHWLGATGAAAPLYFEIRAQGEAQNPADWFADSSFR